MAVRQFKIKMSIAVFPALPSGNLQYFILFCALSVCLSVCLSVSLWWFFVFVLCVCVCVCARVYARFVYFVYVCVCTLCVYSVCVCTHARSHTHTLARTHRWRETGEREGGREISEMNEESVPD